MCPKLEFMATLQKQVNKKHTDKKQDSTVFHEPL